MDCHHDLDHVLELKNDLEPLILASGGPELRLYPGKLYISTRKQGIFVFVSNTEQVSHVCRRLQITGRSRVKYGNQIEVSDIIPR